MRIVADENIPQVEAFFAGVGEITRMPGREIVRGDLLHTDILLLRSVTQVNSQLLHGTTVQFVGSATIGEDHIDKQYLRSRGIYYSNAPASNSNSVVEYVLAAILHWCEVRNRALQSLRVGIIGLGAIGSRLQSRLQNLGLTVYGHDPLLGLGQAHCISPQIMDADVISIHTPLTRTGPCPSYHLVNGDFLSRLRGRQLLINSGRGDVVDNDCLLNYLQRGDSSIDVVLDVWPREPELDRELLRQVFLGTPHIAGYSHDGKLKATKILYDFFLQLCQQGIFAGPMEACSPREKQSEDGLIPLTLTEDSSPLAAMQSCIRQAYDICLDHNNLYRLRRSDSLAAEFDALRKNYRRRREFGNFIVQYHSRQKELALALETIGFQTRLLV